MVLGISPEHMFVRHIGRRVTMLFVRYLSSRRLWHRQTLDHVWGVRILWIHSFRTIQCGLMLVGGLGNFCWRINIGPQLEVYYTDRSTIQIRQRAAALVASMVWSGQIQKYSLPRSHRTRIEQLQRTPNEIQQDPEQRRKKRGVELQDS